MNTKVTSVLDYLSSVPDARPVQGVEGGRLWRTRAGAFVAAAPTPGNAHLLVLQTGQTDPSALAGPVLRHAIEQWHHLLSEDAPVSTAPSFRAEGAGFDVVVAFHPDTHNFERRENPAVHARAFQVFPAYHFEVPSRLTKTEAKTLKSPQLVMFTDINREPVPIIRARFQLKTHRSTGTDRALAKFTMMKPAVEGLLGDPDGFVELENYLGEVARLSSNRAEYCVALAGGSTRVKREDLWPWLDAFVSDGLGGKVTHAAEASTQSGAAPSLRIDPQLTLRVSDGAVADGLAEWQLRQELERLGTPSSEFAVLSRDGSHYAQCHSRDDGSFDVEVREGGPEAHYESEQKLGHDEMIELMMRYASGQDWRRGIKWRKMRLPR